MPNQAVPVYQPYHIYHPYQRKTLNYERRNLITEISGYPKPLSFDSTYGMNCSQPRLVVRLISLNLYVL